MAYIRKLKSGRWQASIRKINEPNQSKTFTTKGDAERWATEIEARMNRREFFDISEAGKMTLAAAFEKYLNEVTPQKRVKKWRSLGFWHLYNCLLQQSHLQILQRMMFQIIKIPDLNLANQKVL